MVNIYATLIWYYYICPREVWLMARNINSFQDNDLLKIGIMINEDSYKRDKKEVQIDNLKIDVIRSRGNHLVIGEIKKSSRFMKASEMQLLFYLYKLKKKGVEASGELLFPKEKKKVKVELSQENTAELEDAIEDVKRIIQLDRIPELKKNKYCKKCAYKEFCWS